MKLLIIEDDEIIAKIYRNKFLTDGYQVEIASDGEAGFEMVKSFRPDVIMLDLVLPKMPGVELIKKIRGTSDFEKTPVIVFSNTYLTNMIQEAWKAGATKCLSKANCTPNQVLDIVRKSLGKGNSTGTAPSPAAAVSPPQPAPGGSPAARSTQSDADGKSQARLRNSFIESLPGMLAGLRSQLQGLTKAENETIRLEQLHELYRRIHVLTGNAGIAGLLRIAQMADALEALLEELYEKPMNINASTLRTVASAIDFLGFLFEHGKRPDKQHAPTTRVLVVDDEAISRRAITFALEKAKLKSVSVEDPAVAYKLVSEGSFDLIFLDVDMPGMNGFELCTRLRTLPAHKQTPVVFVTSLNDLESRANSTVSGGNDFIAKPFLFIELAVKALAHVLRKKIELGE